MNDVRVFDLTPRPCRHERHASMAETYRCLQRNGVPGFDVREVELDRRV